MLMAVSRLRSGQPGQGKHGTAFAMSPGLDLAAGAVSGFAGALVGQPGPPVLIYLHGGSFVSGRKNREARPLIYRLASQGWLCISANYRLSPAARFPDHLVDVKKVIAWVREHGHEYGADPGVVIVAGSSAGGHLASTASTHYATPVIANPAKISLRPDFSVLIYPVISFTDSIGHIGSRTNLIGENPSEDKIREYSNELRVNGQTPPAFLVHASDDDVVKVSNSVQYYDALIRNKVPAELRLYPQGGHGFGMHNATTSDNWMNNLKTWLKANRFI